MGWIHSFDAKYWKTVGGREVVDRQKECDRICAWETRDERWNVTMRGRVLKSAMVGSTYYAAVEITHPQKGYRKVIAAVFLTCGRTRHDGTVWGYKDMDETMGPCERECPVSILNLLTPTDSKWANEWREDCRKNAAEKARRRKVAAKPVPIPLGVGVEFRRGSWILTSQNFRYRTGYTGIRYTKRAWHSLDAAIEDFLGKYGTPEQKTVWDETKKGAAA